MENLNLGDPEQVKRVERVFGRSVRTLREEHRLTQQQLSEVVTRRGMPLSQSQVAKIEAGERGVSLAEATVIAGAFAEPLDNLTVPNDIRDEIFHKVRQLIAKSRELVDVQIQLIVLETDLDRIAFNIKRHDQLTPGEQETIDEIKALLARHRE
jgi:transcriptional regulator with XRE-family HTH domain